MQLHLWFIENSYSDVTPGHFTLRPLGQMDLGQIFLERTRQKSIKTCKLWILYKFGKKNLSTQGEFGFPLILCTNIPSPDKLLMPKLPKSAPMQMFRRLLCIGPLASTVNAQWTNFYSPPTKLVESFILLIEGRSVKHPSSRYMLLNMLRKIFHLPHVVDD